MLAAVAAADITPAPGPILQGHWSTTPSHGVLQPLEARAIVFRSGETTIAMIALDIIGIERDITDEIRQLIQQRCGIPPQHVIIAASHTHSGPPVLKTLGSTRSAESIVRIRDACVACVEAALTRLEPVTLGIGCASAHFNINRRPLPGSTHRNGFSVNHGAVNDRRVRVLRVDSAGGHPLAVLFHYTCHPTARRGADGLISPDYPGVARRRIEAALGCRALFLPGCFGNIRPLLLDDRGEFTTATPQQLDALGDALATAVCRAVASLRTMRDDHLAAAEMPVQFRYGEPMTRAQLEAIMQEATAAARAVRGPWAQRTLQRIERGEHFTSETSVMSALRIGPLLIVAIPGEPVLEIGYALERALHMRPGVHDLWPVGYTNDMIGYLCTQRQHAEGGYEPTAYVWYDRPAPFNEEEPTILAAAEQLVRAIAPAQ